MTIGAYFAKAIAENNYKSEIINGKTYKAVEIRDKDGNLIGSTGLFDTIKLPSGEEVSELVGKRETSSSGSFFGLGNVGVDAYGKIGFTDAAIEYVYEGIRQTQTIKDGQQTYADVYDLRGAGQQLLTVTPDEKLGYNVYGASGEYVDVEIDYMNNFVSSLNGIDDTSIADIQFNGVTFFSDSDKQVLFSRYGLTETDLENMMVELKTEGNNNYFDIKSKTESSIENKAKIAQATIAIWDYINDDYQHSPNNTQAAKIIDTFVEGYKLTHNYDDKPLWYQLLIEYVQTYRNDNEN